MPHRRRLILPLLPIALAGVAFAHEREFTQSRDGFLPREGEHELALRNDFNTTERTTPAWGFSSRGVRVDHLNLLASYLVAVNDRDGSNFDLLTVMLEFEI